jgi:hypothetical protein
MVEDLAFDFASHNVRAARNETQALKEFNIPPILLDNVSRAAMTVSRRDCDLIPKMGKSLPSKASPLDLAQRKNDISSFAGQTRQVVCFRIMME